VQLSGDFATFAIWPRSRSIRRRDFEEERHTLGELAEAVSREGQLVYER
jgi:hypothetical protein